MLTILAVGQDAELLSTRAAVLRKCNAGVISASPSEASLILKGQPFDLVVMCHTLSTDEMNELSLLARRQGSDVQVLEVLDAVESSWNRQPSAADDIVQSKPEALVAKVTEMLSVSAR
jgi:CheY-like chemotaxis protein